MYQSQFVEIFKTDNVRRNQKVYKSLFKEIKHGVPQGSVLGPLLFLLYINDLPLNIQDANLALFADYFNILPIDKNIDAVQARLNRLIKQFETWFSNSSLIVNTDKTRALLFHLNKTCNLVMPKVVFKNDEISYTSEVKFLGINISYNLKWNTHIQFLCSKLNKVSYIILSLRGDLTLRRLMSYIYGAPILDVSRSHTTTQHSR